MTESRTSSARHAARRTLVALTLGAGLALTPLPALANTSATTVAASPVVAPTPAAQVAVDTALAQVGDPYVWGGGGPDAFDCSGLTQFAYGAAGIYLPHSSRMQSGIGAPIAYADLQPGDLVFFYSPVSHVGMYIGDGQMVHSPYAGSVVQVVDLAYMPGFAGGRRLA